MRSIIVVLGLVAVVAGVQGADLPNCLDVAKDPKIINATMSFLINTKECQTDADCSSVEGGPMVCPAKMKVCMPTLMAERIDNPTECQGVNGTVSKPDCVSGFRRNKSTNQCEFRGPRLCSADGDCPEEQKCQESKTQPFSGKRCYTPCDPEAEKIAEANNWATQCGMTRNTPPGEQKTRMQKIVGCDPKGNICGLKLDRSKLVRMVKANRDAFIPKAEPATTA